MAGQPKKEWLRLAVIAEYTARIARELAQGKGDEKEQCRKVKDGVRRQTDQIESIMRYLIRTRHSSNSGYIEIDLKQAGQTFARYTRLGDQAFHEEHLIQKGRLLDCEATRKAVCEVFTSRFGDDDPDWIGESLCDLDLCHSVKEFLLWGEAHGMDVKEQLRYTEKKEWGL